jgi:hypothetical protein
MFKNPPVTPQDLIGEYISLRDQKKAADEMYATFIRQHYGQRMEEIELILLDFLNTEAGSNSISGDSGTAYKKVDTSVTVADAKAFREYVIANQRFELIDWRAAKTPIMENVEAGEALPPGINFSQRASVGIRRK